MINWRRTRCLYRLLRCANEGLPEDRSEILEQVETLTRVRQNNDRAMAYCQTHTRLILEMLAGSRHSQCIPSCRGATRN